MNSTEIAVNRLTSSNADPFTHTPAYKDSSVNMTVLAEVGQTPLPPTNWRTNGHPTPQNGVEVQRKWAQPGYRMPGSENGLVQLRRNHAGNGDTK
jgi:formate dehydrogenase major subunit